MPVNEANKFKHQFNLYLRRLKQYNQVFVSVSDQGANENSSPEDTYSVHLCICLILNKVYCVLYWFSLLE